MARELARQPAHASIGPCGIEISRAVRPAQSNPRLQLDLVELKFGKEVEYSVIRTLQLDLVELKYLQAQGFAVAGQPLQLDLVELK